LAATGAGLHVAALSIEHEAHISVVAVVATTAVPLAIYVVSLYGLYSLLTREIDPFHLWLLGGTAVCIAVAMALAATDAPLAACLLVLALAPAITVVGYELVGHRHKDEMLARAHAGQSME
jgi:4-hydroxybenzoate polyprenyltransferase